MCKSSLLSGLLNVLPAGNDFGPILYQEAKRFPWQRVVGELTQIHLSLTEGAGQGPAAASLDVRAVVFRERDQTTS